MVSDGELALETDTLNIEEIGIIVLISSADSDYLKFIKTYLRLSENKNDLRARIQECYEGAENYLIISHRPILPWIGSFFVFKPHL